MILIKNRNRRTYLEILDIMLSELYSNEKITNIMYLTRVNWKTLHKYIDELVNLKFIVYNNGKFVLTDKGMKLYYLIKDLSFE